MFLLGSKNSKVGELPMRDYGELMAEAAGDGYDSPAQAAEARRRARLEAAAEQLADEYAEEVDDE
jgi:hypothetical protein